MHTQLHGKEVMKINLVTYLCAGLLATVVTSVADAQTCDASNQEVYDQCVTDAVESCRVVTPGCSNIPLIIEQALTTVRSKCVDRFTRDSDCKVCVTRFIRDTARGSSRILFPGFSRELNVALRNLRDTECSVDEQTELPEE